MQDMRPYVCIFESCTKDQEMFVSSEDWLQHMQEEHAVRQWVCAVCDSDYRQVFDTEQLLVNHLREATKHSNEYTEAQFPVIIKSSLRRMPLEIASCPLCQSRGEDMQGNSTLIDHIAEHLHGFALRALPWDEQISETETSARAHNSAGYQSMTSESSVVEEEQTTMESVLLILRGEVVTTEESLRITDERLRGRRPNLRETQFKLFLATFDLGMLQNVDSDAGLDQEAFLRCIAALRRVQELLQEVETNIPEERFDTLQDQLETEKEVLVATSLQVSRELAIKASAARHAEIDMVTSHTISQYGLTEVHSAQAPLVEYVMSMVSKHNLNNTNIRASSIVFIHGLNGHPHDTWATTKPDTFWPSELLPMVLQEQSARILLYGYDASLSVFTDGMSKDKIHNQAEHLASRLVANRSVCISFHVRHICFILT
jgi:hypothetical protein